MSAIWKRIDPAESDRLDMHLITAAITLYATGAFTGGEIVTGLNTVLQEVLTAAEQSDLATLEAWATAPAALEQKLVRLQILSSVLVAAERGLIGEAAFDQEVGL